MSHDNVGLAEEIKSGVGAQPRKKLIYLLCLGLANKSPFATSSTLIPWCHDFCKIYSTFKTRKANAIIVKQTRLVKNHFSMNIRDYKALQ